MIIPALMDAFGTAAEKAIRFADARAMIPPCQESMEKLDAAGWQIEYRTVVGLRPVPPIAIITSPEGRPVINRYDTPEDYARYLRARYTAVYGKADNGPSLG